MKSPVLLLALTAGLASGEGSPDTSSRHEGTDVSRFALLRSLKGVRPSSMSPAGNAYAVYEGNLIRIVDAGTGRELHKLTGHAGNIHDAGWSADGRVLATSGYDGFVWVWNIGTGKSLAELEAHVGYACSVAVSPDGKRVATGGSEDRLVKIFRVEGGRQLLSLDTPDGATYALGFTGDGAQLVASTGDNTVRAWKSIDGSREQTILAAAGYIHSYTFSRNGKYMAVPSEDGTIRVLETASWRERTRAYVSSELGGTVSVIDVPNNVVIDTITMPEGSRSMGLALSHDDRRLYVTNGRAKTLSVVDLSTHEVVDSVEVS